MSEHALHDIQNLRGMDEFKLLANKLGLIAKNRNALSAVQIRLPNYLFAVAPGCGATTYLHLMASLLDELGLIRFEGERKCFEWIIDKKAFEPNGAFDRLLDKVRYMAGFRNNFYGVIGVDIDDWCEEPDSAKINRLLDFVEDMQGQILFVFIVNLEKEERVSAIAERLSREMPLETVCFPMPTEKELTLVLSDFLMERGFVIEESALLYLLDLMPKFKALKHFDGFQTLDNLADEIVYRLCSEKEVDITDITKESLFFIDQPGGYLERLENTADNRRGKYRRIGFAARRDGQ